MITENRKHTSSISALIHSLINNKIQGAVPLMKCICVKIVNSLDVVHAKIIEDPGYTICA